MEVLSCSGTSYIGESDCPIRGPDAASKHDGKSECFRNAEQVQAVLKDDNLEVNLRESHIVRDDGAQLSTKNFPASDGSLNGNGYEFDVDSHNISFDSHGLEDENLDKMDHFAGPDMVLDVDTNEAGLPNNNQEWQSPSGMKAVEQDKPQAVWVKWRGLWQAGIRCARADWPLSTLRAKPTRDSKQYLMIFFPRTRTCSWADVLLVRPIYEFPQPIAYKTHKAGLKLVKDLTLARRSIMQKLSVSLVNILDRLQREALVENARDVSVLKEFAMDASRCKDYSDLGRMLSKLQTLILDRCITSTWLQQSLQSWRQRCLDAISAESIETLKEELSDSILWDVVSSLSGAAEQLELGSEWRSWKHEVMKWFSAWHPMDPSAVSDQPSNNNISPLTTGIQPSPSRKRPKLEIRRADTHASSSHNSVPSQTDLTFFSGFDANSVSLDAELLQQESLVENAALEGSPSGLTRKWDDIIVEGENSEVIPIKSMELTPTHIVSQKLESGSHSRQCVAFIEAKGRQCVRYANEGNVYCCVHLNFTFTGTPAKAEATPVPPSDSPMCCGTTVLGTKCKHRALIGYSFCKKHRPHDGNTMASPVNMLKRKNEEIIMYQESKSSTKFMLTGEATTPCQANPLLDIVKSVPGSNVEAVQCIGSGNEPCPEVPKRHSLYCEKHIPSWLKRARNGKSRIVSKEVFVEVLKDCNSREKKLQLHQACELFYKLFKSILSSRNQVPKDVQFQWAISEASKDPSVGEFLMKLVCHEKERLQKMWGFGETQNLQPLAIVEPVPTPVHTMSYNDPDENVIKCKICSVEFLDDQALSVHWRDSHKKEAQWLFRGYVCAICLDSFTNKKVLEAHVQERHHVQFVEQCMLLQCIPCGSSFGNPDQLWLHVFSSHPSNLRLANTSQQNADASLPGVEANMSVTVDQMKYENQLGNRRFICRFCGSKFDLLPDLGRHHQAAHMGQNPIGPRLIKKGIQFYAQKLKSGRLTRPRFRKGLNSASYKIRNRSVQNLKKRIQASNSVRPLEVMVQSTVPEVDTLGRLADSQCVSVAKLLFSEVKNTKPRPTNSEILSLASSSCCKASLQASLEVKYGVLPEKMYLRAAKLCSEQNIAVEWHQDGFVCPRGCMAIVRSPALSPLDHMPQYVSEGNSSVPSDVTTLEWKMDESHCVLDSRHFSLDLSENNITLCDDISFGLESVPIACVVDENLLNAEGSDGPSAVFSFPWEGFSYVTKPVLDQSLALDLESSQLGCGCTYSMCSPGLCDHVYLFNNDYEDAKDIYGKSMQGRFPYDERGRIILEEGYLVYECNRRCHCNRACQNRVLQNGVHLKLEVFRTEIKGWAVRTREPILRGTFVCEYIGEVIDENEAKERRDRYGEEGCKYFYEIDAHVNDMSRLVEEQVTYVIDATNSGNVSRYINHSCSPNLVNHQVLVESMDSQLAHIGLYASRDIACGEELTYDFRYKQLPGEGCPCLCGASNCRGRLY